MVHIVFFFSSKFCIVFFEQFWGKQKQHAQGDRFLFAYRDFSVFFKVVLGVCFAKRGKEQSVFMCVCVWFLLCSGLLLLLRIWWILLVNISWFASNTILRYLSFKNSYSFWSFVNFTLRIDIAVFIFFFLV